MRLGDESEFPVEALEKTKQNKTVSKPKTGVLSYLCAKTHHIAKSDLASIKQILKKSD